jgi:amidase
VNIDEYQSYDAVGLAELVARDEVSPGELLDVAQAVATARNPSINALTQDLGPFARHEIERGLPHGPFRGVPFLLKDQYQQLTGTVTTAGSKVFADAVADHDSTLTARYRAAGFVIFAKTSSPELAMSSTTEPALFGPTRNPWNLDHSAGGSSGGAAAAVAAGIVPVAHASDGGGSIRIPASACGLVGLKPTRGRVPLGPIAFENWAGATCAHVVSRTLRDTAAVLDATAGPELGDSYVCYPHEGTFVAELSQAPGRLRVALMTEPWRPSHVDAEVTAAVEAAAQQLEALGHHVERAHPHFDVEAVLGAFGVITSTGTAVVLDAAAERRGRPIAEDDVEPTTWFSYQRGRTLTATAYATAVAAVQMATRRAAFFHTSYDILLSPTLATVPPRIGAFANPDPLQTLIATGRFAPFTAMMNLTGQPSISLPLARSTSGLPIGVMFTSGLGTEGLLLRLAAQLEAANPWPTAPARSA